VPQRINYHIPDAIDCNTLVTALGNDFSVLPNIESRYERDQVVVVVRCYKISQPGGDQVQVQAIVRSPLRGARSAYQMQYSALLDCWHQLDRGLLAVAKTPIEYGWNGRPQRPLRHEQ
jgi:hypothetical protein